MFASFLRPNNLSQKMLRVIFSIYLGVTFLVTSLQFVTEYVSTQDSISNELIQLEETVRGPISTSLWQYNQTQLDALITGLVKMPIIVGVDLNDKNGKSIVYERSFKSDSAPLSIFDTKTDLNWTVNGETVLLGTLVLYSSSEVVLDRVIFGFSLIAITAIIKISVLFWLFIWAFNRYLASPLKELMSQLEDVQQRQNISNRINLSNIEDNELSQLQKHLNNMLITLEMDQEKLLEDEQSKRNWLEQAVTSRTQELQILNEKLALLARKDSLTGTLNRGSFLKLHRIYLYLPSAKNRLPHLF